MVGYGGRLVLCIVGLFPLNLLCDDDENSMMRLTSAHRPGVRNDLPQFYSGGWNQPRPRSLRPGAFPPAAAPGGPAAPITLRATRDGTAVLHRGALSTAAEESPAPRMNELCALGRGLAHDLVNLFLVIREQIGLARAINEEPEAARGALEAAGQAVSQAEQLTDSFRNLLQGQTGARTPINLSEVIQATGRFIRRTLPVNIAYLGEIQDSPGIWIMGEPTDIRRMLVNLAANARGAMANGGRLRVSLRGKGAVSGNRITHRREGAPARAVLSVEDTGEGMDLKTMSRIFEPFFTTKPVGQGTGLGMTVVWNTVQAHGGMIEIESKVGCGTRIDVTFPCVSSFS